MSIAQANKTISYWMRGCRTALRFLSFFAAASAWTYVTGDPSWAWTTRGAPYTFSWEDSNYPGFAKSVDGGNTFTTGNIAILDGCKFPLVAPLGPSNDSQALMSFTKMKQGERGEIYYSIYPFSSRGLSIWYTP